MRRARTFALAAASEARQSGSELDAEHDRDDASLDRASPYGLVLDDDPERSDQRSMSKRDFLAALRVAVTNACDRELRVVGRTAQGCPDIERWIDHFARRSARDVEEAIRLWAAPRRPQEARDLIDSVAGRAQEAVARWARTGRAVMPDGSLVTAQPVGDQGRPVPLQLAAAVERVLGVSLPDARVFRGAEAQALTARHNAHALAFGRSIMLAREAAPDDSIAGQAILAHELSHLAEGDRADGPLPREVDHDAAGETRADVVAAHVVAGTLGAPARRVGGARRTGALALHACSREPNVTEQANLTKALDLAVGDTPIIKAAVVAAYGTSFENIRVDSVAKGNAAETSGGTTTFPDTTLAQSPGTLGGLLLHEFGHLDDTGGSAAGHPNEGYAYAVELTILQRALTRVPAGDPGRAPLEARIKTLEKMSGGAVAAGLLAAGYDVAYKRMFLALRLLYAVIDNTPPHWRGIKPSGWDPMDRDKAQRWVVALLTEDLSSGTSDAVKLLKWAETNINEVGAALTPPTPAAAPSTTPSTTPAPATSTRPSGSGTGTKLPPTRR